MGERERSRVLVGARARAAIVRVHRTRAYTAQFEQIKIFTKVINYPLNWVCHHHHRQAPSNMHTGIPRRSAAYTKCAHSRSTLTRTSMLEELQSSRRCGCARLQRYTAHARSKWNRVRTAITHSADRCVRPRSTLAAVAAPRLCDTCCVRVCCPHGDHSTPHQHMPESDFSFYKFKWRTSRAAFECVHFSVEGCACARRAQACGSLLGSMLRCEFAMRTLQRMPRHPFPHTNANTHLVHARCVCVSFKRAHTHTTSDTLRSCVVRAWCVCAQVRNMCDGDNCINNNGADISFARFSRVHVAGCVAAVH